MSAPIATTATATASASTTVHIELPGAAALTERGNWDACSIVAELDALHVCAWGNIPFDDAAATDAKLKQWRAEYIAAGRWTVGGGTTLGNIYWHLQRHAPHIAAYQRYSATPDLNALHTLLKRQLVAGNPVILEVSNAAALPRAEQGVRYHFVTLVGIDSALGYLVANGDTLDALTTTAFLLPKYWATWATLVKAGICGAIALDASYKPATPPPAPDSAPTSPDTLALAQQALSALQSLVAKLQAGS